MGVSITYGSYDQMNDLDTPQKLIEFILSLAAPIDLRGGHRRSYYNVLSEKRRRLTPTTTYMIRPLINHLEQLVIWDLTPKLVNNHNRLAAITVLPPIIIFP